jgi:hypothetical protein
MANPTSNFNWQMPTASDLVTDLPADFEVFGQAVDTSLADLKGGTTGQVLSKTSGTDMDFTWVTTDDANAIQNSIVDAKGDLIAASANDTPARLAVGNNGETLVADSSTSTGLRYQNFKTVNYCLNSDTSIWQRGTSIAAAGSVVYGADRFSFYRGSLGTGATMSRQAAALTGFQYSMRIARDSGNTNTEQILANQVLESSQSIPLAGKTVTLSFWAKAGANFSGGSMSAAIVTGTGTDQSPNTLRFGGWTSQAAPLNAPQAITTTWARYQATATLGSTITQAAILLGFVPTGTAGANDWLEVTGIQLEVGSVATAFQTATGTIQGELAACQRYYETGRKELWSGNTTNASAYALNVRFAVTKRTTSPTVTIVSSYLIGFPSIAANEIGAQSFRIAGTSNSTASGSILGCEEWNASAEL